MKYFYSSIVISLIGIGISFYLGGWAAVYICSLLAILEISLSFDNAVVNAKVLNTMEPIWQKRFITFGIPIAVFGMRFVFPVLIVALATGLGMGETFLLALNEPEHYKEVLEGSKDVIYAFGGSFLLMVFLDFLFEEKENFWIRIFEDNSLVKSFSLVRFNSLVVGILASLIIFLLTGSTKILFSCVLAIILHVGISSLDSFFSTETTKNGLMGFLYLEVLDASFSFDGVIGAFALSSNIFIIMIGLGIGAFFVRSITLYLVHKKTLKQFVFLEHGAHYAILMLSIIMLCELFFEISEVVTGTIGVLFILASLYSSFKFNRKNL
ncbi:MAG: hypothetical protein CR967_03085 [Proteobacteria bacterium]|nr:MAG: hypothetical protein CR967_03085 [Pseudomonadota bacterium]